MKPEKTTRIMGIPEVREVSTAVDFMMPIPWGFKSWLWLPVCRCYSYMAEIDTGGYVYCPYHETRKGGIKETWRSHRY